VERVNVQASIDVELRLGSEGLEELVLEGGQQAGTGAGDEGLGGGEGSQGCEAGEKMGWPGVGGGQEESEGIGRRHEEGKGEADGKGEGREGWEGRDTCVFGDGCRFAIDREWRGKLAALCAVVNAGVRGGRVKGRGVLVTSLLEGSRGKVS
jgi:hypothetical protein